MGVNVSGGALEFDAIINDSQFGATIKRIESQLQGLTQTAEKEATAVENLIKRTTQAIAGYASFAAGTNFVRDIISVRGEFQQLEVAFKTMLGSKEKADKLLAEVTEFAATTPFELTEVAGATKQLLAFGISADKIKPTLRSLGDISAGIGAPLKDIAFLFGTIKTQGVALTQDVRQFAQRGIPIYEELAKVLNVNTEQVGDFITAGKVGFPEIEKAFQNMTAEGSKFGGLMEAQSKTLVGQISNLRDAWDQMLNTLGKGQEGLFSDIISGATFLVQHFEDVIDIIKVLVITYGSYKAAIIASNAVQAVATTLAKGYTIAETLRYQAMLLSERAMKLLNLAMSKNPAALVIAGISGLVSALIIFGKRADQSKSKSELLSDAMDKVGDSVAEQEAKIRPYVDALKLGNVSEQQRIDIYNKLAQIDPKIVEGLNAKSISYKNLSENVNLYLNSLRKQFQLEANKEAVQQSIKLEESLKKRIATAKKIQASQNEISKTSNASVFAPGTGAVADQIAQENIEDLQKSLEKQQQTTQELGETTVQQESEKQAAVKRTVKVIDDEIKALKDRQQQESVNKKQFDEFQKQINTLEEERKKITGATKAETKALQVEENKALALLEKRKDLLEKISDAQKNANQSGFQKTQSELDKINERYDDIIDNVTDYNKKVDEFNKKSPKNQVQRIGQTDILSLNKARTQELDNTRLKEDAERFKKSLEDQKKVFEQFEEFKKDVGVKKANEMFADQLQGNKSYLELLQKEAARLLPKVTLGIANIGEQEKLKAVLEEFSALDKKNTAESLEDKKKKFVDLLNATVTFKTKEAEINKRYDELEKTLKENSTLEQFEDRKKILGQGRADELNQLKIDIARASALYKKLNQDILLFNREQLKEKLKDLKKSLKDGANLTPQMKQDIQNTIDQYEGLLDSTNDVVKDFSKLSDQLGQISGIFGQLGDGVEDLNSGLADTLNTLSQMVGVASNAAAAIAKFAAGDIVGSVASLVTAVIGVFSIGKKVRESRRQAQAEIDEFNTHILAGEIEITQQYRQRQIEQAKLNKLTLEGLRDQRQVLEQQKRLVIDQYNSILAQLQAQSFVADEVTKKYGGILGIGRKTKAVEVFQSLAGKSFDDLEKLFAEGRLVGKGKELFEELQKIKKEGVDIDALLAQNAEDAKQIFTGTTVDSLVDSIAQGFAEGNRSAADFADNFQDLMRNAMIQSLKFQFLEAPLKDFLDQFAAATQSDNTLTSAEIDQLQTLYNSIITNAQSQFDQLQQVSGLNFGGQGGGSVNSLQGAIKGMTEQQAELLAGQFGGLRITALEHLQVGNRQLESINAIQINTAMTIIRLESIIRKFDAYETGASSLKVRI
jgi:uncharacterized protein YoxC